MFRRSLFVAVLIVTCSAAAGTALADDDKAGDSGDTSEPEPVMIDYQGKLQNADGKPISGVFNLEFNIYESENSAEPDWSERQYVAVADGSYKVPLGRKTDLRRQELDATPWIGIELVGEGEILRDRLTLRKSGVADTGSNPDAMPSGPDSSKTRDLLEKARNTDKMAFADVAERAVTADTAKQAETAEKLGSMNADEVERLSNLALERLGEHIADPNAHDASGGGLQDKRRVMESVGGSGGVQYERECPPGYVVTGINGGAGRVVDSISLICQPLK
jgi:hypothetical protein